MTRTVVLLSGGVDSACLLAEAASVSEQVEGLFIDYGQASARSERDASLAIAAHHRCQWSEIVLSAPASGEGELLGRNAMLVHCALFWLAPSEPVVLQLGIHAGTGYRDCTPEFLALMQRSLDFHTGGIAQLVAPFLQWTKPTVIARARELGIPFELTHSCEAGDGMCGACRSCLDREALIARA